MKCFRLPLLAGLLAPLLFSPLLAQEKAAPAKIGSMVWRWEDLAVNPTPVGARRDVARNPTATLGEFECHISTLNPAQASHPPHIHSQEELIILREGTLDVHVNGTDTRVGPGSLFFFASNNPHAVQNRGDKPATYFVFNFATGATAGMKGQISGPTTEKHLGASIFEWEKLAVKPTATGERRDVFDRPTATFANFECHVTTIKAGVSPHAPHHHGDEEVVLLKEGQLDVTINGKTQQIGPGSIVFVSSNDEHGWKNSGTTPATYYVLRLRTDQTPHD
jgi:quercetin dioxygenase-like cupin family protein